MLDLRDTVARALHEDVGAGDLTAEAVVPGDVRASARIVQKAPGVIYGFAAAAETFRQAGADRFESLVGEGEWSADVPRDIARVSGSARAILTGERTALNFLAHLAGVATVTAQFVRAAGPGGARVLDTRKTTPGLLLDNMTISGLRSAVVARDAAARNNGRGAELEASGGVSLATVPEIASTGVDFISVGALTHSAPALDLSLLFEPA